MRKTVKKRKLPEVVRKGKTAPSASPVPAQNDPAEQLREAKRKLAEAQKKREAEKEARLASKVEQAKGATVTDLELTQTKGHTPDSNAVYLGQAKNATTVDRAYEVTAHFPFPQAFTGDVFITEPASDTKENYQALPLLEVEVGALYQEVVNEYFYNKALTAPFFLETGQDSAFEDILKGDDQTEKEKIRLEFMKLGNEYVANQDELWINFLEIFEHILDFSKIDGSAKSADEKKAEAQKSIKAIEDKITEIKNILTATSGKIKEMRALLKDPNAHTVGALKLTQEEKKKTIAEKLKDVLTFNGLGITTVLDQDSIDSFLSTLTASDLREASFDYLKIEQQGQEHFIELQKKLTEAGHPIKTDPIFAITPKTGETISLIARDGAQTVALNKRTAIVRYKVIGGNAPGKSYNQDRVELQIDKPAVWCRLDRQAFIDMINNGTMEIVEPSAKDAQYLEWLKNSSTPLPELIRYIHGATVTGRENYRLADMLETDPVLRERALQALNERFFNYVRAFNITELNTILTDQNASLVIADYLIPSVGAAPRSINCEVRLPDVPALRLAITGNEAQDRLALTADQTGLVAQLKSALAQKEAGATTPATAEAQEVLEAQAKEVCENAQKKAQDIASLLSGLLDENFSQGLAKAFQAYGPEANKTDGTTDNFTAQLKATLEQAQQISTTISANIHIDDFIKAAWSKGEPTKALANLNQLDVLLGKLQNGLRALKKIDFTAATALQEKITSAETQYQAAQKAKEKISDQLLSVQTAKKATNETLDTSLTDDLKSAQAELKKKSDILTELRQQQADLPAVTSGFLEHLTDFGKTANQIALVAQELKLTSFGLSEAEGWGAVPEKVSLKNKTSEIASIDQLIEAMPPAIFDKNRRRYEFVDGEGAFILENMISFGFTPKDYASGRRGTEFIWTHEYGKTFGLHNATRYAAEVDDFQAGFHLVPLIPDANGVLVRQEPLAHIIYYRNFLEFFKSGKLKPAGTPSPDDVPTEKIRSVSSSSASVDATEKAGLRQEPAAAAKAEDRFFQEGMSEEERRKYIRLDDVDGLPDVTDLLAETPVRSLTPEEIKKFTRETVIAGLLADGYLTTEEVKQGQGLMEPLEIEDKFVTKVDGQKVDISFTDNKVWVMVRDETETEQVLNGVSGEYEYSTPQMIDFIKLFKDGVIFRKKSEPPKPDGGEEPTPAAPDTVELNATPEIPSTATAETPAPEGGRAELQPYENFGREYLFNYLLAKFRLTDKDIVHDLPTDHYLTRSFTTKAGQSLNMRFTKDIVLITPSKTADSDISFHGIPGITGRYKYKTQDMPYLLSLFDDGQIVRRTFQEMPTTEGTYITREATTEPIGSAFLGNERFLEELSPDEEEVPADSAVAQIEPAQAQEQPVEELPGATEEFLPQSGSTQKTPIENRMTEVPSTEKQTGTASDAEQFDDIALTPDDSEDSGEIIDEYTSELSDPNETETNKKKVDSAAV
ncbi:MAG: hypothetical protein A2233_04375 [Candidatus Kerfeldbacteria bacterium RIFOXYA2_FULL_38_24]|uniref:Uncharacterized protein n=1 Tax=Candidatus Kerfeldbacteria bacterium RIFOXYB2_FULL_38_14 TaxID=1798547 RepID=A0A1G2BBC8_9BACT|nr:MAG: hypothetical protein A2233_04375 [Candidatus Kerfeldbacteria bacterium RIFOXYA2_FULL_38_24]OGY86335.1 MAG: hypothetical protein A2319_02975 [Candidatus Kerfeldbacteria bacterium RIFOXYB2_FULL_38_14]OGY88435.1 MAG: hypothetical protein A2458_02315 [Candidatus Kerfeldbacteria bacterium RIFOXYC2_FULL_38_9]